MTKQEIKNDIRDGVRSWKAIGRSIVPVFYLYNYYPQRMDKINDLSKKVREWLWAFKNGDPSQTNITVNVIAKTLKHFFLKETLSQLTLVCIPASSEEKNKKRYMSFSRSLCNKLGMYNAFDYIKLRYNRESAHTGGSRDFDNISFSNNWFYGKKVIIFDDVITSGESIRFMADSLEELGAEVIGAIAYGKTCTQNAGKDPYFSIDMKEKERRSTTRREAGRSAKESAELYKEYRDVTRVASIRGLAESTVIAHLYESGCLDPYDYITDSEYERAIEIYESNYYDSPAQELDGFLDIYAKSAFYYIRKNS